jgi:hypothetical protein
MEDHLRRFAARLYEQSRAHDQGLSDRLECFRNVEPPTAELLGVLIRAVGARQVGLTQTVVPVGAGLRLAVRQS